MSRATREWAIIGLAMYSPVLIAVACFWFAAFLESEHYESQPLNEVELIVRPKRLTDSWFMCNQHDHISETGLYLSCSNKPRARAKN